MYICQRMRVYSYRTSSQRCKNSIEFEFLTLNKYFRSNPSEWDFGQLYLHIQSSKYNLVNIIKYHRLTTKKHLVDFHNKKKF